MAEQRTAVPGSRRVAVAGATRAQAVDPHERIVVTIVVRCSPAARNPATSFQTACRAGRLPRRTAPIQTSWRASNSSPVIRG